MKDLSLQHPAQMRAGARARTQHTRVPIPDFMLAGSRVAVRLRASAVTVRVPGDGGGFLSLQRRQAVFRFWGLGLRAKLKKQKWHEGK